MSEGTKVTVEDLDKLITDLYKAECEKEDKSKEVTAINKKIATLENTITKYLKDLGRTDYSHPLAKTPLKIKEVWRVNMPKDDQAKAELFEHLKERNLFENYATVNSNSLNALYMADWREAQREGRGMEFTMPGIEAPKLFERVDFKMKPRGE